MLNNIVVAFVSLNKTTEDQNENEQEWQKRLSINFTAARRPAGRFKLHRQFISSNLLPLAVA